MKNIVVAASCVVLVGLASPARAAVSFIVSPAAISNTYVGTITLQITGLNNAETVVVQKFSDLNNNGVIDASDYLVQQFNLTDGSASVIGGVRNINVPGDTDATVGQISATLDFGHNFSQTFVGKYLFKLSSPVTRFAPITNLFTVTSFPYAQQFTGNVTSNGTNVPNAVVILLSPVTGSEGGNPQAAAVANDSGAYILQAPAESYTLLALKSNYVGNFSSTLPVLTLGGGATLITNLMLTNATDGISGRCVDAANNSIGLPGVDVFARNDDGLFASGLTDTNGDFTLRVRSGNWKLSTDSASLLVHGYVRSGTDTINANAGETGVTIHFAEVTALLYGNVKDNLNNPLANAKLFASGSNGQGGQGSDTDENGYYVAGIVGGSGPWQIYADNTQNGSLTNYVFSQPTFNQDGGTNINAGQSVQANFTGILATNHITGNVQYNGANVMGVAVFASAFINGQNFLSPGVHTDNDGNYSLNVANGVWSVGLSCQGGDDSLDSILGKAAYQCPGYRNVNITNHNGLENFSIQRCSGLQIITPSRLPDGQVNFRYDSSLQGSNNCDPNFSWSLNDPVDFPPGLSLFSNGELSGYPSTEGTYRFSIHVHDGTGDSTNQSFSLAIVSGPLQVTTASLPNGTNGAFYSQTLQASGGIAPYIWSLAPYSSGLPANLALATNGILSGTLATDGTFYFYARATDTSTNSVDSSALQLTIVTPPRPPLVIANVSLPDGNVYAAYGAQLAATGGNPPYIWSLALGSASTPPGLSLNSGGLISGVPTTNGTFNFIVQAIDAGFTSRTRPFSIIISGRPVLDSPNWLANQFQARLMGTPNQNYALQYSSNLLNWTSLFITNSSTASPFTLVDPNAMNKQGFYRVFIEP